MELLTEALKGWMAGFLEADGMITIRQLHPEHRRTYDIEVGICNTDKDALQPYKDYFGDGYVDIQNQNLPLYHYRIFSKQAYNLLRTLLPYLRIKRERAELAIELQERIDSYRKAGKYILTDGERQARRELYLRMRSLIAKHNSKLGRPTVSEAVKLTRGFTGKPRG